jgi:serine/threonine-protein kinase
MQHPQRYTPHNPSPPPAGSISLGEERTVELGALIGRGTMSFVHQATLHDLRMGLARPVAIKILSPTATDDRAVVESAILRSARRVGYVLHPNVVGVYEFGVFEECQPFLVNELVRGLSLRRFLDGLTAAGRRMPLDLALFIAVEVASALAGAHGALDARGQQLGVIHGELSSREVLLSNEGQVKVCDFELAGARHAASSIRNLKMVAHRAVSLAPEVVSGVPADPRSDVFSLGLLLREMLVGPRFTQPAHHAEVIALARDGAMDSPTFRPRLPRPVFDVLNGALAADPDERFQDAEAFEFELRRVALSLGIGDMRVFLRREMANLSQIAKRNSSPAGPTSQDDADVPSSAPGVSADSRSSALRLRDSTPEAAFRDRWTTEVDE